MVEKKQKKTFFFWVVIVPRNNYSDIFLPKIIDNNTGATIFLVLENFRFYLFVLLKEIN